MSPKFPMLLAAACLALTPAALAQSQTGAGASGAAAARATTIKGSKSNGSEVTRVDAKARTFTAISTKGEERTFVVAKGKPLPTAGKKYDITYTESPGGGPLQATSVNSSKSNGSFKVTAVDTKAKTFTGIDKAGKQFTFAAVRGKPLPTVGKIYDISYTENPGVAQLEAVTTNSSKSNSDN